MQLPTPEEWTADVRRRLASNNLFFTDLGREMGVHPSAVSRWLTNKVEPRLTTMLEVESALAALVAAEALV